MIRCGDSHSLAPKRGDGETGVMLSINLSKLVTRVGEDARSSFRLLGTGRGGH